MPFVTFFSGGSIRRQSSLRDSEAELVRLWHDANTRFVPIWRSQCLVEGARPGLLSHGQLHTAVTLDNSIYLGEREQQHLFAVALPEEANEEPADNAWFENFRGIMSGLQDDDAALLAYAKGMIEWLNRHRHCGVCGTPNILRSGGFALDCPNPDCGNRSFPRIDPAIIVLVHSGDRCLLGRQSSWPEQRFSTLAGFVEPGESLEDAVSREVKEESNVDIDPTNVTYLGSQPWPFPNAMMIGFHAEASSTEIHLNDAELAEAHWYTRDSIRSGEIILPPSTSIAFRLIENWFDQEPGEALASLDLSGDFSRRTGERT